MGEGEYFPKGYFTNQVLDVSYHVHLIPCYRTQTCRHIGFTLVFLPLLDECFLCQIGTTSAALQHHSQGAQFANGGDGTPTSTLHGTLPGVNPLEPNPSCIINPEVLYLTFVSVI